MLEAVRGWGDRLPRDLRCSGRGRPCAPGPLALVISSSRPSKPASTRQVPNCLAQLADQCGASRNTIRSALGELDGRGLIEVVHGKGRVVLARIRDE
ncbi:GntR family transcriptional regulator [Actinoallomurus iriomotensis]|uniref:GntR family transcriptional regulator n=1 Tax=Actinoallomurus iriomotensis TaxID=478107 RepID=UPI003D7F8F12